VHGSAFPALDHLNDASYPWRPGRERISVQLLLEWPSPLSWPTPSVSRANMGADGFWDLGTAVEDDYFILFFGTQLCGMRHLKTEGDYHLRSGYQEAELDNNADVGEECCAVSTMLSASGGCAWLNEKQWWACIESLRLLSLS
jgi:hypothetical protein